MLVAVPSAGICDIPYAELLIIYFYILQRVKVSNLFCCPFSEIFPIDLLEDFEGHIPGLILPIFQK